MQTRLADFIRDTPQGKEAEAILRKCVHCGFCTATCPTYQVLGDDLDSPRGRIYLMKRMLEGAPVTEKTRLHLDRCLTCRACETTCPSGVRYGRLVDIGRELVEARTRRAPWDRMRRALLGFALPRSNFFSAALGLGRAARPLLPSALQKEVGQTGETAGAWPLPRHARKMLALAGCVQPALAPSINAAAARLLDRAGISLLEVPGAGCCGGIRFTLRNCMTQGEEISGLTIMGGGSEYRPCAPAGAVRAANSTRPVVRKNNVIEHSLHLAIKTRTGWRVTVIGGGQLFKPATAPGLSG